MRTDPILRSLVAGALTVALGASFAAFADDVKPVTSNAQADVDKTVSAQPGTDTWITTKVKADLLATENVDGTKINVTTVNGVVTLAGVLDTQVQVDNAIAIVDTSYTVPKTAPRYSWAR